MNVDRLWRRMQNLVAWGATQTVMDDSGGTPTVQAQPTQIELQNGMQILGHFGFSSSPPKGSRFLVLFGAGDRAKGTIVGTVNAQYRRTGLVEGETVVHDMWGNEVHFAQSGITVKQSALVTIDAPNVVVNAPAAVTVTSPQVTIIASGGLRVEGPINCTEEVKAFCDGPFVTLSQHRGHQGTAPPTSGT